MTDKQIIIDENEINPNDWLEPYKPIPACEIKDCEHWVYAGNNVYGCRIAEDGLVCDDFNNDDECCMYRQLEYYKEAIKAKEQECEELKEQLKEMNEVIRTETTRCNLVNILKTELDQLKAENDELKKTVDDLLHKPKIQDKILWKIDNEALLGSKDAYIYKLEKTLTEIREIAEDCMKQDICTTCDNSEKCHIEDEEIPTYDVCKLILQKISECEVE